MIAALRAGRNSIGVEIDREYCRMAAIRLKDETAQLFSQARLVFERREVHPGEPSLTLREEREMYASA